MPGFFVQGGATISCPHGGRVNIIPTGVPRVRVGGQPAALLPWLSTVVGCPFQVPAGPGMKPQPCVRVQWQLPAVRVRVSSQPVLVRTSTGICFSVEGIPQGPPIIALTQMRARGI
jgi:hypothetical protein